jgi:predicted DNA-binding protein with PD1-like motif
MKFSEARQGRVFVIRLEDGEIIHETIERFAEGQGIKAASLILLGGAGAGSRLVVGPQDGRARPVTPMTHELDNVHEIVGTGTLFPDEEGKPTLHLHVAGGREGSAVTGCIRTGVIVWQVVEVVLFELVETSGMRRMEPDLGFKLLTP